ncbi:hypothetical protein HUJ05_008742 [Dendroctonus ponderosae]|nr:hypothetical protein HUJ05_008742 [Dendroctonus ponderosae]
MNKQGITTSNRGEILNIVGNFYQMLMYTSQNGDILNSNTEPDIVTARKVPREQIFIGEEEVALVDKYNYLVHEIQISRDNQTCKLKRRVKLSRNLWKTSGSL